MVGSDWDEAGPHRAESQRFVACPGCRAEMYARQRFCTSCGTALPRVCASCGTTNLPQARFCGRCGVPLTDEPRAPEAASPSAQTRPLPPVGRRHISVLFCDIVDSTTLSTRLDPEDLRTIFGAFHRCCAQVIGAGGGFLAKYLGDGVLAYFGYPEAQENNAAQAVRAGLALVEALGALSTQPAPFPEGENKLRVRVGIASGLVVVGDLLGEGAAQERMVVGETPHLAARMQERAEPGAVVVAEATRRLAGSLYEYRALTPAPLKGFAGEVPAFQVLGASALQSRFRSRGESGLTPLCDRRVELRLLRQLWQQALSGTARAVLITGEAGIGKSRLIAALLDEIGDTRHLRMRLHGIPHYENTPFHPIVAHLRFAAAFARGDTPEQQLAKLEALLAPSEATEEETALIADLLSLPHSATARLAALSPQRRREKTLEAFLARSDVLATRQPVLVIWEDLHWVDPSSLDYIRARIERMAGQPSLMLLTARTGFSPSWVEHPRVIHLPLARLGQDDTARLITGVTGGRALPPDVLGQIVTRSDGVPLFVEELTKSILESGLLREQGGQYVASALEARLAIPATLSDSLTARLDRLAPFRDVVQIGAALGRDFGYDVLAAVAGLPEPQLCAALDALVSADLVVCRGAPPDAVYAFKHALMQDAANGMLLRAERRQIHARIVSVLEEKFPDLAAMQPERVGQHCLEAQLIEKAIGYWLKASRQALARSTTEEAIALLRKAIARLPDIAGRTRRDELELDLRIALGQALSAARGYGDADAEEAFARGRDLCEQLNRPQRLAPVLYGQFLFHFHHMDMEWVRRRGEEACRIGEAENNPALQWLGHRMCGSRLASIGDFAEARAQLERCLALSEFVDNESGGSLPPEGPRVGALFHLVRLLCCLGYVDEARARTRDLVAETHRGNGSGFLGLSGVCFVNWCLRSATATALDNANALLSVSTEQGLAQGLAWGHLFRARCIGLMGKPAEALPQLKSAVAEFRALRIEAGMPMFLCSLAEAHGLAGQPEKGLAWLAEAESLADAKQNRWPSAEMLRMRGSLLSALGDLDAAEVAFRNGLALARTQQARLWELRNAVHLARVLLPRGRRAEAHGVLAPVIAWFGEAVALDELAEARALLAGEFAAG